MREDLQPGVHVEKQWRVADEHCTRRASYQILSTPSMVMFVEATAIHALDAYLDDDEATLGSRLEIRHIAPTLRGMNVRVTATVAEVDRRRVTFDVEIFDDIERIGYGKHDRFVVDLGRYTQRLDEKAVRVKSAEQQG
jgi:fluoroacetyl-CoA thioesterase